MLNSISEPQARQLLAEAMDLSRIIKSNSQAAIQNDYLKDRFRQINQKLQTYNCEVKQDKRSIAQIPLEFRRCFVESLLLQTRYHKLLTKPTGGNYKSPIIDSYQCDRIPDSLQPEKLCHLFDLTPNCLVEIDRKLKEVDTKIIRQKKIIEALLTEHNYAATSTSILNFFQQLFGNIPLLPDNIKCLTTEMQVIFIIDYQDNRLRDKNSWQKLSSDKQQTITSFLENISNFSWQQFAHFPNFSCVEIKNINPRLIENLINKTGYSKAEIINAIASSINIIATKKTESFLLHDIWGHYWQYLLTNFESSYQYLSKVTRDLTINSSVKIKDRKIKLLELFQLNNEGLYLNKPLAIYFFYSAAKERLSHLATHLIAEMLADINEYKWLSQNPERAELLPSSSCLKDFPSKLDLLLQDLDFLYELIFQPLIDLNFSNLAQELTQQLTIKNTDNLNNAIAQLNLVFQTEYTTHYKPLIDNCNEQKQFKKFIFNLLQLQNLLNQIYTQPNPSNFSPYQDLLIIFTATYYQNNLDINNLNSNLIKYFLPCHAIVSQRTN